MAFFFSTALLDGELRMFTSIFLSSYWLRVFGNHIAFLLIIQTLWVKLESKFQLPPLVCEYQYCSSTFPLELHTEEVKMKEKR